MTPSKQMPRASKKSNTKDKGKVIDTTSMVKDPANQGVTRDTRVKSTIVLTKGLAKKVDKSLV